MEERRDKPAGLRSRLRSTSCAAEDRGIKPVAREAGLDERHIRRFLNRHTHPRLSTIAKIEAALRALTAQG